MKRKKAGFTLVLVLVMALSSMALPAFAASKCPDHPNAKVWTVEGCGNFELFSVIKHIMRLPVEYVCSVCQKHLGSGVENTFDFHRFSSNNGGQCSVCGWNRPTRDDLKAEAWGYISDIDTRSGWVLYSGTLYSEAGGATKVGSVSTNQNLRIIEHADVGGVLWVRVCNGIDIQNPIGWISTELISIDPTLTPPPRDYEGHNVRITVSSGRARSGAGNYPIIEYVKLDEIYYVNKQESGTDGKTWLQVKVDGKDAWISAGLVTIID